MSAYSSEERIRALEAQVEQLTRLQEQTLGNTVILYKRINVLAQMIEALGAGTLPLPTRSMRAEIDASLQPEAFMELFRRDAQEFTRRYGEDIFEQVLTHGERAICRFGELANATHRDKASLQ